MKENSGKLWAVGTLVRFLYILGSVLISCVALLLVMKVINRTFYLEGAAEPLIRASLHTLLSLAVISALAYREGHHFVEYSPRRILLEVIPATLVHLLICFLLGFSRWVAGGVAEFAGLFYYGSGFSADSSLLTKDIPVWAFLLSYLITAALYTVCMIVAQKYGKLKRLAEREELISGQNNTATDNEKE